MNRRGFILGALSAPAVITTPGLLMPVRALEPQHGWYSPFCQPPVRFVGHVYDKPGTYMVKWVSTSVDGMVVEHGATAQA